MKITRKLAALFLTSSLIGIASASASETPIEFKAKGVDQPVKAYEGQIMVPENRQAKASRDIPLHYVRFPTTSKNPGAPIIYLAGGPGGSGIATARDRRFAMFMALRAYGDVIALDQRGAGKSRTIKSCQSQAKMPQDKFITDAEYISMHRSALRSCLTQWQAAGVDVAGYNTVENAADIDDLRRALGADKVTLWGISYGSHLALAAIKQMGDHIDRVILASAEGLNQTIKQPARTDAYFNRLQAAINAKPDVKAMFPDVKGLISRVHAELDANPVTLSIPMGEGAPVSYFFQRRDMQQIASAMISDPVRAAQLLQLYQAVDAGVYEPIAGFLSFAVRRGLLSVGGQPLRMDMMSTAMDIASGMTEDRKVMIADQAKTALLGDYLNFSYHYDGVAPQLDLGDDFRSAPVSDVPVLLFSGTLDGRTYIESQRESVFGLSNTTIVTVKNAGHNLYMVSPKVQETINLFMEGKPITEFQISVPLPSFNRRR